MQELQEDNTTSRCLRLRIHNPSLYHDQDLLVNTGIKDYLQVVGGDILRLSKPDDPQVACFLKVTDVSSIQGTKSEISISQNVAERFQFTGHSLVQVSNLGPNVKPLSFVEVVVKNQYLSSSEMWRLKFLLNGQCIYTGKVLFLDRLQARVKSLFMDASQVESGLVSHETKFNFRSQSAKTIWLIEFSKELWNETMDGRLYFELIVEFIERILERWNSNGLQHILSMIVFSRVFYKDRWATKVTSRSLLTRRDFHRFVDIQIDENNRPYSDLYFPLLTNERVGHSRSIVPRIIGSLKRLFYRFPLLIGCSSLLEKFEYEAHVDCDEASTSFILPGCAELSSSEESNLLEAFNLCQNDFEHHYVDRELKATGSHVVIFTASRGVWKVRESLVKLTKRRVMSSGVGWEILSVGNPITDQAPVFVLQSAKDGNNLTNKGWKYRGENKLMHLSRSITIAQMQRTDQTDALDYKFPRDWFPLRFIGPRFPTLSASSESFENETIRFYMDDLRTEEDSYSASNYMHTYDSLFSVLSVPFSQGYLLNKFPRSTSVDFFHHRKDEQRNNTHKESTGFWKSFGMAKEPIQGEASHTGKSSKEFSVGSKPSSNLTRWAHSIFPTAMDTDWFAVALEDIPPWIAYEPHEETRVVEMQRQIIWNNLLEPSILPLTTEFAPNSIFSKSYFVQYLYTLPLPPRLKTDRQLFSESARALVKELVCQRMVQDFQVVVHLSDELFWKNLASPELYEKTIERHVTSLMYSKRRQKPSYPNEQLDQIRCVLAKGREYHELTINPENYTIQIRRFVKVDSPEKRIPVMNYHYNLFCVNSGVFVSKIRSFSAQTDSINWNRLDQVLVEGPVLPLTSELLMKEFQARVVRFAIIPSVNQTIERIWQFLKAITREEIGVELLPVEPLDGYPRKEEQSWIKLDMGMFKGARHEWIILGIDKFHIPSVAFHWTVYWLVCEGGVVEDYIEFCSRRAKQQGLTCCKVPFDFENAQSSWTISTCWYDINVALWKHAIEELLLGEGFFLDEEDSKNLSLMHYSGCCMVRLRKEDETISWIESIAIENTHSARKNIFHSISTSIYVSKLVQTVLRHVVDRAAIID